MTLKAPGLLTPGLADARPQRRDTRDPYELPEAPRGMMHSPTIHGVHELETGAPKGRGPDGKIIDERTLSRPVPPPRRRSRR